ncbi:monooxygenase 2-like [Amaranthus tricolor]|uniref:monooxygenase 2-like n=1 Tax=Amaranthus tricolor TaxID=29722 RepID=UPI00258AE6D7|nr:monooxygenase 2-like [Amaranthus tricolor]
MEETTDILIVGAGISGLATALALHRLGIRSLVLESSDTLRAAGIAFTTWTNAWRALDALGIADSLRQQHGQLFGIYTSSTVTGNLTSHVSFTNKGTYGDHEVRCVKRKALLEALAKELPNDTIRYSSKLVSIEDLGFLKLVHLADGSTLKTKVLLGCDGVTSVVAKWLGFKQPSLTGRSAIRGCAYYHKGHDFEPNFQQFVGNGVRYGIVPCDDNAVYWFFTWSPSPQENRQLLEADQQKLKQFVLSKLGKVPKQIRAVIEDTNVQEIVRSPLGYRPPLEILFGNISKDNVCVLGDACHPMTPDLGQGGCSALEDGVILARCLGDAFFVSNQHSGFENDDEYTYERIKIGLNNYAKTRRWRGFELISTGYWLGWIQEFDLFGMRFLRDNFLSVFLSGLFLKKADVDPKELKL